MLLELCDVVIGLLGQLTSRLRKGEREVGCSDDQCYRSVIDRLALNQKVERGNGKSILVLYSLILEGKQKEDRRPYHPLTQPLTHSLTSIMSAIGTCLLLAATGARTAQDGGRRRGMGEGKMERRDG